MLYVLIPLALMLLAVAAWALIWAIRSGQFDDLESHGWSVVLDDDQRPPGADDEENPAGGHARQRSDGSSEPGTGATGEGDREP
jgi:cbb3-type cytochrome oxidase maturation protein